MGGGEAGMPNTAILVTILLAFAGYGATYLNNVRIEQRRAKLKYVSDQLQYLYGPLFSLTSASNEAWAAFRSRCRPGGPFFGRLPPPTKAELEQWRLWMRQVFMPMNLQMRDAIIDNAHLIEGDRMPEAFRDLLAHVETYKIALRRWEEGDFSEHTAYLDFPHDFAPEVADTFGILKSRQARLIGRMT